MEEQSAGRTVRLDIRSDPAELPQVREAIRRAAGGVGFDDETVHQLILAVDEALANVIKHGYEGRQDQPVEVTLTPVEEAGRQGLAVGIRDFGKQVDTAAICGRDLDEVRPGGLGVHLIKSIMDRVDYAAADGGGMRVEMIKFRKP